jgi:hypothetical protein
MVDARGLVTAPTNGTIKKGAKFCKKLSYDNVGQAASSISIAT